jgi:hypothetical protein
VIKSQDFGLRLRDQPCARGSPLDELRVQRIPHGRWHEIDYARYLQDYATHHGIDVTFGVEVTSVRTVAGGQRVSGSGTG